MWYQTQQKGYRARLRDTQKSTRGRMKSLALQEARVLLLCHEQVQTDHPEVQAG